MNGSEPPLFVANLFLKVLVAVLACVVVGLFVYAEILGPLLTRDIVGTLICAPLVAYLIHLWVAPLHDPDTDGKQQ